MRALALVFVGLGIANAVLFGLRRSLSEERAVLADVGSTLTREASDARALRERERALSALVATARRRAGAPRDIGELRDVLVGAEHGLGVDRLLLDFRPEERLPTGFGGSRVHASLRGTFDALYRYLARIEAMLLPLSPENVTLRGESSSLTMTVQWEARWPLEGHHSSPAGSELSESEQSRLNRWLSRESQPLPGRDPFAPGAIGAPVGPVPAAGEDLQPPPESETETPPERPVLTGFVLARPELEPDVRRRVLAALRYAGEVRLVMVGDTIGAYVVESMEARDSVTLEHAETGDRIQLTLH